jgi:hypothetical protein
MTREELERAIYKRTGDFVTERVLDRVLELIAAEREACARVCEPQDKWDDPLTAHTIAAAIRARGSK